MTDDEIDDEAERLLLAALWANPTGGAEKLRLTLHRQSKELGEAVAGGNDKEAARLAACIAEIQRALSKPTG